MQTAFLFLPVPILARVLLHALSVDAERVVPAPIEALPLKEMQTLALVCRDWHAHMERLYLQLMRRTVDLVVSRNGFCVKRHDESIVNPTTPDLEAEILRVKVKGDDEEEEEELSWSCDWHAVMKLFPNVRRLDLSKVSVRSRHAPALLEAASMHCSRVEALLLTHVDWYALDDAWGGGNWAHGGGFEGEEGDSGEEEEEEEEDEAGDFSSEDESDDERLTYGALAGEKRLHIGHELDSVCDALYAAFARWHESGPRHGLRLLGLIERRSVDRTDANNTFLRALATFCPLLECFQGPSVAMGIVVQDNWACDLEVWCQFCDSCVHLRRFDWLVLPFADAFIVPFPTTTKPQLRSLTIGYKEHEHGFPSDYLTVSPAALVSLFASLPALEELAFRCTGRASEALTRLSQLLTDDVVVALATSCPRLRRIEWSGLSSFGAANLPLVAITDETLTTLATLPSFEKLDIPFSTTSCSEIGLMAFVRCVRRQTRTLRLKLDPTGERGAVTMFIDQILSSEDDIFQQTRLQMELSRWKEVTDDQIRDWTKRLEARHVVAAFSRAYVSSGVGPVYFVRLTSEGLT